jgi:hypothetical protein
MKNFAEQFLMGRWPPTKHEKWWAFYQVRAVRTLQKTP